jgi:2-iminobutanoate/2-iminopropanoate deaminase
MTDHTPEASPKPFSRASTHNGVVYTSGQVGLDGSGKAPGFADQVRLAFDNLAAVLEEHGASLRTIVKTTVFVVRRADVEEMNRIYVEYLPEPRPARSTIIAELVRPELLFEIEAIARIES